MEALKQISSELKNLKLLSRCLNTERMPQSLPLSPSTCQELALKFLFRRKKQEKEDIADVYE